MKLSSTSNNIYTKNVLYFTIISLSAFNTPYNFAFIVDLDDRKNVDTVRIYGGSTESERRSIM